MDSTCFFCHLSYYSILTKEERSKINKLFLTYLEVINISLVDIHDVGGEVPFHACPPCATILQNISTHILQVEEEMKKIYAIILRNSGDGGVGKPGELKTEIMSGYNSNVKRNYVKNVTSTRPPLLFAIQSPSLIAPAPPFANPPPPLIPPAPDPTTRIIHPADPTPSPIMIIPADPETIKLETDPEPLKIETDPREEAEVDLDDFMIHPDDNNDMDVDPSVDPLAPPSPPYLRGGRPLKNNPYPPGWSRRFGGVEVTRVDHKRFPCGFQCGECDFQHKIWIHMRRHIEEKHQSEFKCRSCSVSYATKELLTTHITLKHAVHSCEHCDFTAIFPSHLKNHVSISHPELPLKCPTCRRVLVLSQAAFDKHVKKCRVGFKKFPRPTSVQTSETTWTYLDVAMAQVDDKVICSRCEYTNPKKHAVMKHIRANHTKHLPFRCPNFVCGWPFANQTLLDEHLASSGHGPQVCDVCGKVCRSKHSLRQHVIVAHEKSKRFICITCGKGFHQLSVCTKHESTCLAANNGKARKLNKEEKAVLAAARKSILEQKIISNSCKHCAKRIFGSLLSFSFHEEKCRLGSCTDVQTGDEVIKLGIRLIDDSVELSRVKVTEPRVISLWKCWGCNQTFHHRPMGLEHIRAERHGHSDALPPSENT